MKTLLDHVLRGFGQLFVCNNRGTGLCVLIGLFLLSPQSALLALLGASVISWAARRLAKDAEVLKTGLFSVNGALLGAVWMAFPQMPLWAQITATVLGAVVMAKVFVPMAERMHQKRSAYVLFSLPYVAAAWVAILTLMAAGVHDAELTRGWRALLANDLDKAERHFLHTEVHTDEAEASRCAGLGWSLFRRGDQIGAQQAFSRVLTLETGVADAYDGLGWSRFRENRIEDAEMAFRRAVALDGFFADSWDGLGWCALRTQKPAAARRHFTMAVLCAPLFADAWQGLALTFPSPNLSPGEPLTSYRESPAGERDQKAVSLSPANDSQSQLKPTSGERLGEGPSHRREPLLEPSALAFGATHLVTCAAVLAVVLYRHLVAFANERGDGDGRRFDVPDRIEMASWLWRCLTGSESRGDVRGPGRSLPASKPSQRSVDAIARLRDGLGTSVVE